MIKGWFLFFCANFITHTSCMRQAGALKKQKRMEQILEKAKPRMMDALQKKLRLSGYRENVQYYHCTQGAGKNGTYIPKEQMELICRLAQKSYDEKIIKLADKRLSQVRKLAKEYDEIENIYLTEHAERNLL